MGGCINNVLVELKRLFFFENCTDTAKLGLVLYFLTYLGSLLNFLTLLTLSWVFVFTLPCAYSLNKEKVDQIFDIAPKLEKLRNLMAPTSKIEAMDSHSPKKEE